MMYVANALVGVLIGLLIRTIVKQHREIEKLRGIHKFIDDYGNELSVIVGAMEEEMFNDEKRL